MPADPAITAAACRYLLVALLPRLESVRPGLVAELSDGVRGDRGAIQAKQKTPPELQAVFDEALKILSLATPISD